MMASFGWAEDAATSTQKQIDQGLAYLKSQQNPDDGWQGEKDPPAITAIVLKAFAQEPSVGAQTDFVKKGYDRLLSYQVDSGGIYKDLLANYNTSIAISALVAAQNPEYQAQIDKAVVYVKGLQWTDETAPEGEVITKESPWFGGWGYGGRSRGKGRPDLSNAQMSIEALHDAGLKPDDEAYQNAIIFISRQQNFSETNDRDWAGNDGGFIYGPADHGNGESNGGEYTGPDGQRMLRSYGSMTYAGFKSMIFAGLTKDDPRVKAAWGWISGNWTLDENPGLREGNPENAQWGIYYYYHTLARALNAYDQPTIVDPQGNSHDWRVEFASKSASLQKPDGSWIGEGKWMESNPVLVTAYMVLALQETRQDLTEHAVKVP
jgi:squalene-hopene/tetraprenyl-beta-curcumene cyclase